MKEFKFWQWLKRNLAPILMVLVLVLNVSAAILIINSVTEYKQQIAELQLQITYLQDTTNVIQTNVNNMESNVQAVLEEEASILEDLDIELYSCHFAEGTYDVKVNVVPKDYTDTMRASIFFGTKEYALYMDGFSYSAIITLPLDMNYEGNVTVLFTDGSRRSTEVRKEYTDVQSRFDSVIRGDVGKEPDYIEGTLSMDNSIYYHLKANNRWKFTQFDAVLEVAGEEVYAQDLKSAETDILEEDLDGEAKVTYSGEVEPGAQVRIYLRAVTEDNMTFLYDLYNGYTATTGDGFAESPSEYVAHYEIYDDKGGCWYVY